MTYRRWQRALGPFVCVVRRYGLGKSITYPDLMTITGSVLQKTMVTLARRSNFVQLCILGGLAAAIPMYPQEPKLHLISPEATEISVSHHDSSAHPAFNSFFEDALTARAQPYSLVLTNLSSKSIVGLAVRWTYLDSTGQPQISNLFSDSLLTHSRALAAPGDQILITPSMFVPAALGSSGFTGVGMEVMRSDVERLERSANPAAEVDLVIFEDGEAIGPDRSETALSIQARKKAADKLAGEVRAVRSQGRNMSSMLAHLASNRPGRRAEGVRLEADLIDLWVSRFADQLLRAPDPDAAVANLANLPTITLYRK